MLPIARRSLDVQAADVLREEIVSGRLTPTARLTEIELAEKLGLSRGTIRAALRSLVAEGLVDQSPYAGWHVVDLSARDVWELFTLRAALDALGARLLAEAIDGAGCERLRAGLSAIDAACADGNATEAHRADWALHRTIANLGGHQRLEAQYRLIEQQTRMYFNHPDALTIDLAEFRAQHIALVDAICRHQPARAASIAQAHSTSMGIGLFNRLQAEDETHDDAGAARIWPSGHSAENAMLNHASLGVTDLARAGAFYDRVFAPLGVIRYRPVREGQEIAYGLPGEASLWLYPQQTGQNIVGAGTHIAVTATRRDAVDAFGEAAAAAGAVIHRAAGPHPDISATYYGAVVGDLDGHRIEVVLEEG
jgi:DNA-binding GntR family transcriptional regulator/catechol 2,3-dioxygenase-like lactoylglutathione lyase family enzyme